jgi:hypothetical protein
MNEAYQLYLKSSTQAGRDSADLVILHCQDQLRQHQIKFHLSAANPSRFLLCSLELELRSTHGNRLVIYQEGQWSCNCAFFEEWGRCAHTIATMLLLKDTLFQEQR